MLGLGIEYQCLCKTGLILGEMVYETTLAPVYFKDLYAGTRQTSAFGNPKKSSEEDTMV